MSSPPFPTPPSAASAATSLPEARAAARAALPAPSPGGMRTALRTLQLGAIAVVLAALPYKAFELDRFFVPKELVLHLTAAVAAAALLVRGTPTHARHDAHAARHAARPTAVDLALAAFLALSVASAALATNRWLALRAVALSASSLIVFWTARALARRGHGRALLATLAAAVGLGAATALLQAYGVRSEYFSLNRAPGGTFGNRNFVAHLAAIGLPLLVTVGLRARTSAGALAATLGTGAAAAVLVLSRSRGAWLGAAAALLPLAVGVLRARGLAGARPRPLLPILLALALAGAAAVVVPNTLDWRSDSPYLDSAKGIVEYRRGSGGGRLKQYANSARMTAAHPALGVGPGNWPVRYPAYAPPGDPSLADDRMTANPWPSSDWVAVASERGLPALAALGLAIVGLFWWAHRATWRSADADRTLLGGALGGTLAATVVVGLFDAVLLLAAPALLAWAAVGALAGESRATDDALRPVAEPAGLRRAGALALLLLAVAGVARSASQAGAMALFDTGRPAPLAWAVRLDPGSYRIRLRAAELAARRGRCAAVRAEAGAAAALFPEAPAPRRLLAGCGGRRRGR